MKYQSQHKYNPKSTKYKSNIQRCCRILSWSGFCTKRQQQQQFKEKTQSWNKFHFSILISLHQVFNAVWKSVWAVLEMGWSSNWGRGLAVPSALHCPVSQTTCQYVPPSQEEKCHVSKRFVMYWWHCCLLCFIIGFFYPQVKIELRRWSWINIWIAGLFSNKADSVSSCSNTPTCFNKK